MRRLVFAGILALSAPAATMAQDWDGWYVGVEAGRASTSTFSYISMEEYPATYRPTALVGGHLWSAGEGYLLGVEGEVGILNMDSYVLPPGYSRFYNHRIYASLSAKAGLPFDRFLPYATAGLQAMSVDAGADYSFVPGGPIFQSTLRGFGVLPTASVGAEFLLTGNLSLKVEASHVFGSVLLEQDNGATSRFSPGTSVNVGMNFRF
ncbi:MAG: hypothetical protein ABS76_15575 [Pelagibacterium sp. SCN 64-44]|nr:MAG: hypothetical protein ABS76_15575 [Pelagibacterium sp. SCN 64-44]